MRHAIRGIQARLAGGEEGFTLVEAMVAIGILATSVLLLAYAAGVSFTGASVARQRQEATAIGNQIVEQVRGLPYASVGKGLSDSDLSGDSNIVTCSSVYYFKVCPDADSSAELLVHTPGLTSTPPLVNHVTTFGTPDYTTTFTAKAYVTTAKGVPSAGAYRVTAIVSWVTAERSGTSSQVQLQTLIFTPDGCASTTTHPYGAPCQAFFHSDATIEPGNVMTTGSVAGVTFDAIQVDMPEIDASVQAEQTVHVTGTSQLNGGSSTIGGTVTTVGDASSASQADNDPASSNPTWDSKSLGPGTAGTASATGGGTTLSVTPAAGSTGATASTTAATGTQTCTSQTDSYPCGYSTITQGGDSDEVLALGGGTGSATLVHVTSQSSPSTVYTRKAPVTGQDGLARSTTTRLIQELRLGGLPSGITAPTGWSGYWVRLNAYSGTAQTEVGSSTAAPSVTIGGGQVQAWNGTGYTSTNVTTTGGSVAITSVNVTKTDSGGNTVNVQISGTISIAASTATSTVSSGTTRTAASASLGAPLVATVTYILKVNGAEKANLTLTTSLGAGTAVGTYQPAPLAG